MREIKFAIRAVVVGVMSLCFALSHLHATETVSFSTSSGATKKNMKWGYDVSQSSTSVASDSIVGLGGAANVDWTRQGSAYGYPLENWDPVTRIGTLAQAKKDNLDYTGGYIGHFAGVKSYTITRGDQSDTWFWANPSDYWAGVNVDRYAGAIIAEAQYFWDKYGMVCEGVGLRNEADFWVSYSQSPQPTDSQFTQIAAILHAHPLFANADVFGPSTLSPSVSAYNSIAGPVDKAESHKLGGSTSTLKSLIQTAIANGDGFVNTETHAVAEQLMNGHYGGSGGNFWDYADFSRGTLALSQRGGWEVGYAENLGNETAAAVYRSPEGDLRAFVGGMERSGSDTMYRLVSTDRDVYFDGFGPIREYMMEGVQGKYGEVVNIDYGGDVIGLGAGFEGHRWKLVNRQTGQVLSVVGASTSNGANINIADDNGGESQKWDLVRSSKGAWGLSNANSGRALTPVNGSSASGTQIQQWNAVDNSYKYWRLNSAGDGYFYLQNYDNINYLTGGASYCVQSGFTGSSLQQWKFVSADPIPSGTLVSRYQFDGNGNDSASSNHAMVFGSPAYIARQIGQAIDLNGSSDYVTLPAGVANSADITIAAWVNWDGSSNWQRIFDFSNDTTNYMYLTPKSSEGNMEFGITTGGPATKQILVTDALPTGQWVHVAVTLRGNIGVLYTNGVPRVAGRITVNPTGFNPTINYIGKDQFGDPLFNGRIDDFRIYNYALNQAQIAALVPASSAGNYTWTGGASSEWSTGSIASPKNWQVSSNGTPIDYGDGNSVVFNDSASNFTVSVTASITPAAITFDAVTNYTLTGAAGIAGTNSLTKKGTGILNINNTNTYTGATAINGGTVNLNGSLSGTAITVTDAALIQGGSGVISGNSNFTSFGSTSLAGNNTLGTVRSAGASSIHIDGGTTSASGQISIGDITGGAAVLAVSTGTLNADKATAPSVVVGGASGAVGVMNLSGGTVNTASELWVVGSGGASGTLNLSGGVLNVPSWLAVGRSSGDKGTVNITGGTLNVTGQHLTLASFSGCVGEMNLYGGTVTLAGDFYVGEGGTGTLNVWGPATLNANGPNGVRVAVNAGSTGIVNLKSGGTLTTDAPFTKGAGTSIFGFDGGTLHAAASGSPFFQGFSQVLVRGGGARIDTDGFNLTITNSLVRELATGDSSDLLKMDVGTLILAGSNALTRVVDVDTGSSTANDGALRAAHPKALSGLTLIRIRNNGLGYSALELDGSQGAVVAFAPISLSGRNNTAPAIRNLSGTNFLAGTITAQTGGTDYRIQSDAGVLNLSGSVALTSAATGSRTFTLQGSGDGVVSGVISNGSASPFNVVKSGTGTWKLSGTNTYTGTTTVSSGTLAVNGSLAAGNAVTVASGATLTGTGSISGPVAFAGGSRLGWNLSTNSPFASALSAGAISVSGGAVVNLVFNDSGSTVDFSTGFWAANHTWPVLNCSSMTGTFALGSISTDSVGHSITNYGTFYLQQSATGVTLFYASLNSEPPLPPTGVSAKSFSGGVALVWTGSFGASSYNVLRSVNSGGPYDLVASNILNPAYNDSSVANGTTYYYVIVAVNSNGQSNPTGEIIANPHLPAIVNKLDNTTNLDQSGSWLGNIIPTTADTARWAGLSGANSVVLGSDASWNGIIVATNGGAVSIGGSNTLNLGTGGIDMSVASQNLTISSGLEIGAGNQTWNAASGRTLTLNTGTFSRSQGATLNLQGTGTYAASMTGITNVNSIIGPWATVGTGTSSRYAMLSSGNLTSYSGATSVTSMGFATSGTTATTVNYDVTSTTATTFSLTRGANTIRYTGGGLTESGSGKAYLNGILNAGTGTYSLSLSGGSGIEIGSAQELTLIAANAGITIPGPISDTTINNGGVATSSAVTVAGSNIVRLQSANLYTGGTFLNSGELQVDNDSGLGSGALTINGGTLTARTGQRAFANAVKINGDFTLNGTGAGGNMLTLSGSVNLGGSTRTITVPASNGAVISGGISNGSLTKAGGTTLTLSGSNTYNGFTTISQGTLTLSGSGSVNNSSTITVSNGAVFNVSAGSFTLGPGQTLNGNGTVTGTAVINGTVAPGSSIGTLTFSSPPTLNGTTLMEINRTNSPNSDRIVLSSGTLTYGGTLTVTNIGPALQSGDSFQLFSATGFTGAFTATNLPPLNPGLAWKFTPTAGVLSVMSTVATNSTNIFTILSSNMLTLTWPTDHTGWTLQAQTNPPGVGLGSNWFSMAGSATTNQMQIPIDPSNGSRFYRLIYP